jgi:phosphoglycolate phosphatase (TIGR01487 family)
VTPAASRARLRALVTDIDGTLTNQDRRLDLAAVRVLRSLEAKGVIVVLATGNVLPVALGIHRSIGLSGPIVAENGGLLYRRVDGHDSLEPLASIEVAREALRRIRRARIPVRLLFTDRWRETEIALEPTPRLADVQRCLRGTRAIAESTGYAIHLMERGSGKRSSVAKALAPYGLSLAECVVAGDGDNDVGMLRAAGFGVSFPNGSPKARAAAEFVSARPFAPGFCDGVKASGIVGGASRSRT